MKTPSFLFFLLLLIFLVLPLVNAEDLTFQVNKNFDLKRACSDRGFFCDNGFDCNLTLIYPDGNLMIDNKNMTFSGSFRNFTINYTQNNQLGLHPAIMECSNGTDAGIDTFQVVITADGKEFQVFPTQIIIIFFGFALIGVGFISERLRMFKHLGSILIIIMGVLTLYPGYSFINWTTLMGKGFGFTLCGIGFYFLIEGAFSREKQVETYQQDDDGRFHEDD